MSEVYSGTATRAWQIVLGCSPNMKCAPRCWAVKTVNRVASGPNEKVRAAHEGLVETCQDDCGKTHMRWTGIVRLNEAHLLDPLRHRKPEAYAVGYHGDWARLADGDKDRMFAVMALANWHEFRPLSKQAAMVREYFARLQKMADEWAPNTVRKSFSPADVLNFKWMHETFGRGPAFPYHEWPLRNVRLGFSLMTQPDADAALPHARALHESGWKIWVSLEPQVGPIDLKGWEWLTWVVQGCESGPQARYFNKGWACFTRNFCQAHGIPYSLKQMPVDGRVVEHPFLDGRQWTELPEAHG